MNPLVLASSNASPVLGAIAAITLVVGLMMRARRDGKRRKSLIVGGAIFAVLAAIGFAVTLAGGSSSHSWNSADGRQERAGFIDGCNSSVGQLADCKCVFERLTSESPYDTPDGFNKLLPKLENAKSAADVPPALMSAVRACQVRS
jgi:hypothetical protein